MPEFPGLPGRYGRTGPRSLHSVGSTRQLEHGRRLGDRRETIRGGGPLHTAARSGTELAAEAERSLVEIDAEIAQLVSRS